VRPAARIVFVTAHDEHALRAFAVNALDYLVKPVEVARLADTVRRALGAGSPPKLGDDAHWKTRGWRADDSILVRLDGGARVLPLASIAVISSNENYCEIELATGERLLVRHTMKAWEESLPSPPFVRSHRQALVNLAQLIRLEDDGEGAPLLHFHGARAPVRVSRREWPALRALLPKTGVVAWH
jgi:two-component system LytT family response regulator